MLDHSLCLDHWCLLKLRFEYEISIINLFSAGLIIVLKPVILCNLLPFLLISADIVNGFKTVGKKIHRGTDRKRKHDCVSLISLSLGSHIKKTFLDYGNFKWRDFFWQMLSWFCCSVIFYCHGKVCGLTQEYSSEKILLTLIKKCWTRV